MTNSAIAPKSLRFTDLLSNGQGVARDGTRVVFCFGPLPGERARVRITSEKPSYAVAELVELEERAPERAEPFCPVFGACGGCQAQHLSYPAQLEWKRRMVQSALQRIGGIHDAAVAETAGVQQQRAYRNKISLVVESRGETSHVGFYRYRSHEMVAIDGCPVAAPLLDAYIGVLAESAQPAVRDALREARHVVARSARHGEGVIAITTKQRSERVAATGAALLDALPHLAGVVNSYEPRSENAVLGRRQRLIAGREHIEEQVAGIRYRVSPASFFQVNVEILERILEVLERELLPAQRVVDLYCGIGTFSLFFAKHGAHAIGIEEHAGAVEEAVVNAALNELAERCAFHAALVERWAQSPKGRQALAAADTLFLDPPRKGSDEATLRAILAARPRRIGYLSCDPATLARDLKLLVANGYRLTTVQPFDMFPHTGHVETLVILNA